MSNIFFKRACLVFITEVNYTLQLRLIHVKQATDKQQTQQIRLLYFGLTEENLAGNYYSGRSRIIIAKLAVWLDFPLPFARTHAVGAKTLVDVMLDLF